MCEAVRELDEMYCARCNLRWAIDEPESEIPECLTDAQLAIQKIKENMSDE